MGDLACRRPGTRLGGRHVVDPDGRTIAEVPSTPQNAAVAARRGVTAICQASPPSNANSQFRPVCASCEVSVMLG
jgi:hypothetical protein